MSGRGDPGRAAAVVLAAGEGSRFDGGSSRPEGGAGVPKLLAPFRGRPLAAWALDAALGAGFDAVVLVTGAVDLDAVLSRAPGQVTVVRNPRWSQGQATSLLAGLEWCADAGMEAAVVGVADQPLVPSSAWRAVRSSVTAPIVTASYGGRRSPPVRLARPVWRLVATSGDEGARELMRRRPDLVGEVACEGDPADVDTIGDLRRLDAAPLPDTPAPSTTERG